MCWPRRPPSPRCRLPENRARVPESILLTYTTRVDTLTSIRVFRQVVESGSFVAAAERMDLSTAMVSKHVAYVEKRLGVRLRGLPHC